MADRIDIDLTPLVNVVREYATEFERLTKKKLIEADKVASGALVASIKTRVEINGTIYTVWLDSKDYLKYVEYDTRPHFPPPDAMLKWVREKKSIATREKTGNKNLPTERQVAFLVGRKISEEGTKGIGAVAGTVEELNAVYLKRMEDALYQSVAQSLPYIHIELRFK